MWADLPPGTWTAALIGPWWPAPSTALRAGAQHWGEACAEQQLYSQTLRTQWTLFAAQNQGHTADDLIDRFQQGEKFHLDLAEKYQTKASAFNSAADATDYLRSRLAEIANRVITRSIKYLRRRSCFRKVSGNTSCTGAL